MHTRVNNRKHVFGRRSDWIIIGAVWVVLVTVSRAQSPNDVGVEPPGASERVYERYQKAVRGAAADHFSTEFYASWEAEFRTALRHDANTSAAKFRVFDELGAIQTRLGKGGEALTTYREMELAAVEAGSLDARVIALENQWELSRSLPFEKREAIATELEETIRSSITTPEASRRLGDQYSETLLDIGQMYFQHAENLGPDADQLTDQYYDKAKKRFARAVEFAGGDVAGSATELFYLAKVQDRLGEARDAAASFQRLLDSDQTTFSRLWIGHLSIEATTEKDSVEYRDAIRGALTHGAPSDDYSLPLKQELAMSHLRVNEFEDAAQILEELLGQDGDGDVEAYNMYLLARSYDSLGKTDLARKLMAEILAEHPDSPTRELVNRFLAVGNEADAFHEELQDSIPSVKTALDESVRFLEPSASVAKEQVAKPVDQPAPKTEPSSPSSQVQPSPLRSDGETASRGLTPGAWVAVLVSVLTGVSLAVILIWRRRRTIHEGGE